MVAFTFIVPVKPKAVSANWELVLANLHATVRSVLGSADPNFRLLLASHDDLDLPEDPRIESFIVDFPHTEIVKSGIKDKQAKLRFLGSVLRSEQYAGYVMFLDADDLVSNKLVGYVRKDNNQKSYLMKQGMRLDVTNGNLSFQAQAFDKSCGSCFVGYFEASDFPEDHSDRSNYFSGFLRHTECFEVAEAYGRTPTIIDGAAVVYVTNHSDSLRMARLDGAVRRVSDASNLPNAAKMLKDEYSFVLN
jgi:hypothetical protein